MLGKSTTLSIFALSSHIFPQPWGNATKITWLTSHPLAKKHRKMTWQSCWDVDKNPILGAILLSTYIKIDDRSSQVSSHWEPKRIDWCCKRIESAGRFYWWPLCSKKTLENETFVFQVVWKKIAMSLQKHNKLQRKKMAWHVCCWTFPWCSGGSACGILDGLDRFLKGKNCRNWRGWTRLDRQIDSNRLDRYLNRWEGRGER